MEKELVGAFSVSEYFNYQCTSVSMTRTLVCMHQIIVTI